MKKPDLVEIKGIAQAKAKLLKEAGIHSVQEVVDAALEKMTAIPGFSARLAAAVKQSAADVLKQWNEAMAEKTPPPKTPVKPRAQPQKSAEIVSLDVEPPVAPVIFLPTPEHEDVPPKKEAKAVKKADKPKKTNKEEGILKKDKKNKDKKAKANKDKAKKEKARKDKVKKEKAKKDKAKKEKTKKEKAKKDKPSKAKPEKSKDSTQGKDKKSKSSKSDKSKKKKKG